MIPREAPRKLVVVVVVVVTGGGATDWTTSRPPSGLGAVPPLQ